MSKFPKLELKTYEQARPELRSGDVLLASGEYMFSKLIQRATGSCWSHVAFVMRLDVIDRVMVLESIEGKGVRTIPLSEYVRNFEGTASGYKGRLAIARHQGFAAKASPEALKDMAQFAVDRFARPYDEEEIARITARIVGAALGFKRSEIARNEEYICSEYVWECYARLGLKIAHDKRGFVAPADFAKDPNMSVLYELQGHPAPAE
jgi:hypothetical protein